MLWLNLLILVIVLSGLILFANGIVYEKEVQVYFGGLFVIFPTFCLTFGLDLIIMAIIFPLSVMYIVRAINSKKQVENNS